MSKALEYVQTTLPLGFSFGGFGGGIDDFPPDAPPRPVPRARIATSSRFSTGAAIAIVDKRRVATANL